MTDDDTRAASRDHPPASVRQLLPVRVDAGWDRPPTTAQKSTASFRPGGHPSPAITTWDTLVVNRLVVVFVDSLDRS
jgi:hypothetical protein